MPFSSLTVSTGLIRQNETAFSESERIPAQELEGIEKMPVFPCPADRSVSFSFGKIAIKCARMIKEARREDRNALLHRCLSLHETQSFEESRELCDPRNQILCDANHHLPFYEPDGKIAEEYSCYRILPMRSRGRHYDFFAGMRDLKALRKRYSSPLSPKETMKTEPVRIKGAGVRNTIRCLS